NTGFRHGTRRHEDTKRSVQGWRGWTCKFCRFVSSCLRVQIRMTLGEWLTAAGYAVGAAVFLAEARRRGWRTDRLVWVALWGLVCQRLLLWPPGGGPLGRVAARCAPSPYPALQRRLLPPALRRGPDAPPTSLARGPALLLLPRLLRRRPLRDRVLARAATGVR